MAKKKKEPLFNIGDLVSHINVNGSVGVIVDFKQYVVVEWLVGGESAFGGYMKPQSGQFFASALRKLASYVEN